MKRQSEAHHDCEAEQIVICDWPPSRLALVLSRRWEDEEEEEEEGVEGRGRRGRRGKGIRGSGKGGER